MKPLPISLRCDCGEAGGVPYGERWTCPRCARSYDTSRVPADDVAALEAVRRRYRRIGWAVAVVVALFVLAVAVAGEPFQILIGLPLVMLAWFFYGRPLVQRRYRRAIAERPRWNLEPEAPEARRST